jgi:hypothetical protein
LNRDFLASYMATCRAFAQVTQRPPRRRGDVFALVRPSRLSAPTHRLFEADAMQKEQLDTAATDFYRPGEFRALLESAEGPMRAVIALQGLAGLAVGRSLAVDMGKRVSASPAISKSPRKTPRHAAAAWLKSARRWPHGWNRFGKWKAAYGTKPPR